MGLTTKGKELKSLKKQMKKYEGTNPIMVEKLKLRINTLENTKK